MYGQFPFFVSKEFFDGKIIGAFQFWEMETDEEEYNIGRWDVP